MGSIATTAVPGFSSTARHPLSRSVRLLLWLLCAAGLLLQAIFLIITPQALHATMLLAAAWWAANILLCSLLAWLLLSTPRNAIKLPRTASEALLVLTAVGIWMLRWYVGYQHLMPEKARQMGWYAFCFLQVIGVLAVLYFLRRANQSPWWACLVIFNWLLGTMCLMPQGAPVIGTLIAILLIAVLIGIQREWKIFAAAALSFAVGLYPLLILLAPLLFLPGNLPDAYTRRRFGRLQWLLMAAAFVLPMAVICLIGRLHGANIWLHSYEPSLGKFKLMGNMPPMFNRGFQLLFLMMWVVTLVAVFRARRHPLAAARAMLLFCTLLMAWTLGDGGAAAFMSAFFLLACGFLTCGWIAVVLLLPLYIVHTNLSLQLPQPWQTPIFIAAWAALCVLIARDVFWVLSGFGDQSEPASGQPK